MKWSTLFGTTIAIYIVVVILLIALSATKIFGGNQIALPIVSIIAAAILGYISYKWYSTYSEHLKWVDKSYELLAAQYRDNDQDKLNQRCKDYVDDNKALKRKDPQLLESLVNILNKPKNLEETYYANNSCTSLAAVFLGQNNPKNIDYSKPAKSYAKGIMEF